MPIEIRELVIRVAIEKYPQKESIAPEALQQLKNEIVNECAVKIMQKIKKSRER